MLALIKPLTSLNPETKILKPSTLASKWYDFRRWCAWKKAPQLEFSWLLGAFEGFIGLELRVRVQGFGFRDFGASDPGVFFKGS